MAKTLSVEEAKQRARDLQDARIEAIGSLAEAHQNVVDVRADVEQRRADFEREVAAELAAAEREDVKRWNAAIAAGWSVQELKKIGYEEPEKKKRATRKRSAPRRAASAASGAVTTGHEDAVTL